MIFAVTSINSVFAYSVESVVLNIALDQPLNLCCKVQFNTISLHGQQFISSVEDAGLYLCCVLTSFNIYSVEKKHYKLFQIVFLLLIILSCGFVYFLREYCVIADYDGQCVEKVSKLTITQLNKFSQPFSCNIITLDQNCYSELMDDAYDFNNGTVKGRTFYDEVIPATCHVNKTIGIGVVDLLALPLSTGYGALPFRDFSPVWRVNDSSVVLVGACAANDGYLDFFKGFIQGAFALLVLVISTFFLR